MIVRHSCMCLQCGRGYEIALEETADPTKEKCPICGGANVIKNNSNDFFKALFGGSGGFAGG